MTSGEQWSDADVADAQTIPGPGSVEGDRVLAHVMTGLFGPEAASPTKIGDFVVLRRLGAGAMGEVFAAYDADLDRRVAIKLLRPQPFAERSRLERNMKREAQALAKLSHPNVVPVFEVGEDAGRLFLVMEMVEGETLRSWLGKSDRTRDQILDMFVQVGRGLEAAHSAKVVHRDLKPDNVLVGADGRARLVDFGLARADTSETEGPAADASQIQPSTIAGTPLYMAPEQFRGDRVDHRADQYAFCVSLYNALYGAPPYSGKSMQEIAVKVLGGEMDPPPPEASVPNAIDRVVKRGLEQDPDKRFENMHALLVALRRARKAPRRRAIAVGLGLVGCLGIAFVARQQQQKLACRREARAAPAAWADARESVEATIVATELPYAEHTVQRIGPELDDWTSQWSSARRESCLARDGDPEGLVAHQDACLDDRLAELDAFLAVLRDADKDVVARAVETVAALPPVADCVDPVRLAATPAPTPEQREAIAALRPRLAEMEALFAAGRSEEASVLAQDLLPDVEAAGHVPTHAQLVLEIGILESRRSKFDEAETWMRDAYFLAGRHGLDRTCAMAASMLVAMLSTQAQRIPEARSWVDHAQMMSDRIDDPEVRISVLHSIAGLELERGNFEKALDMLTETVELSTSLHGELHPGVGVDLISIAAAYNRLGQQEKARAELERAIDLVSRSYGDGHPFVADAIHNLANVEARAGSYDKAIELYRKALAIRERILPADHMSISATLDGLGAAYGMAGDLTESRKFFERALAMTERLLGPEHPRLADSLLNLGVAFMMEGRPEDALRHTERACGLLEDSPGEERPQHASCQEKLADALDALGRREESIAAYKKAIEIWERTAGPEHYRTGLAMSNLGQVLSRGGQHDEALALVQRANAVLTRALPGDHPQFLQTRLGLGKTRLRAGQVDEAREVLEALLEDVPKDDATQRAEVQLSLAEATWQGGNRQRARSLAEASLAAGFADAQPWLDEHPL